jgi:uncharacterized OsmC-like protein
MEVRIEKLGRVSFAAYARQHMVVVDQPESNGGSDVAMTPAELFLASVGTCIGYYVAEYCAARKLDCEDLEIRVSADLLHAPGRLDNIRVDVNLSVELEKDRLDAVIRTALHCTISNTLHYPQEVQVQVHTPVVVTPVSRQVRVDQAAPAKSAFFGVRRFAGRFGCLEFNL